VRRIQIQDHAEWRYINTAHLVLKVPAVMELRSKGKEPFYEEDPDPGPCRMEVRKHGILKVPAIMELRNKGKEPFCEEDPDPGPCRMEVRKNVMNGNGFNKYVNIRNRGQQTHPEASK
jgi:hypothetical protein